MSLRYGPSRRSSPPLWLIVPGILLLVGIGIALVANAPTIVNVSPPPDSMRVAGRTPIVIEFSQPMRPETLEARLSITPMIDGFWEWGEQQARFIPLEEWPQETTVEVRLSSGARSQAGLPLLQDVVWRFTAGAPRVAYLLTELDGVVNIWSVLLDGSDHTALTDTEWGVYEFDPLPDGSRLVFANRREDSGADLYVLDLASGEIGLLLDCLPDSCRNPHVSPDGVWVAYERRLAAGAQLAETIFERDRVEVLALEGGTPERLTGISALVHSPTWVTADQLAFVDESQPTIGLYQLESASTQYIPDVTNEMGSWTAAGPALVYSEMALTVALPSTAVPTPDPSLAVTLQVTPTPTLRPTASPEDILSTHLILYNVQSGVRAELTGLPDIEDTSAAFSPDGQWIAFARKFLESDIWTPGRQLWVMRADGTQARQLTDAPLNAHSSFVWSPDGLTVIFVRFNVADINFPPEVWAISRDGGEPRLLAAGGFLPHWLP